MAEATRNGDDQDRRVPTRLHDLLLGLAGRIDDESLTDAREFLALAEPDQAAELVVGALVAGDVALPAATRAELADLLVEVRSDAALADRVRELGDEGVGAHRFVQDNAPERGVGQAVAGLGRRLSAVSSLRCAWRVTPAGAAPMGTPQRVVVVESTDAAVAPATAFQVARALDAADLPATVEVLLPGRPVPEYQRAASDAGVLVDLNGHARPGPDGGREPERGAGPGPDRERPRRSARPAAPAPPPTRSRPPPRRTPVVDGDRTPRRRLLLAGRTTRASRVSHHGRRRPLPRPGLRDAARTPRRPARTSRSPSPWARWSRRTVARPAHPEGVATRPPRSPRRHRNCPTRTFRERRTPRNGPPRGSPRTSGCSDRPGTAPGERRPAAGEVAPGTRPPTRRAPRPRTRGRRPRSSPLAAPSGRAGPRPGRRTSARSAPIPTQPPTTGRRRPRLPCPAASPAPPPVRRPPTGRCRARNGLRGTRAS
ncbi:hypothetical protein G443_003006 [Actinoalloteichus cyanogriseus DSM 43889]|uniref:Uncharacterized protein n=1 Tax=Actinoalloteichus caeruleus DSM 43889 TaxID=1120930 RepID=A0ABT1JJP0_ACTCY|nr:hypothetical protein [Actinoalloteichus caeruleus DSM 43889]